MTLQAAAAQARIEAQQQETIFLLKRVVPGSEENSLVPVREHCDQALAGQVAVQPPAAAENPPSGLDETSD